MIATNLSEYRKEFFEKGRLESVQIIDCHTHMDDIYDASMPIFRIDDCMQLMERENVKSIWCAPHADLFGTSSVNGHIEAYMRRYPRQVRGYFGFNPNYSERYVAEMHKVLELPGYIGFKFLPVYHNTPLDSEKYLPALELADKYRLIVLSHTWGNTACSPKEAEVLLKKYRNLQFIMGHSSPNELDSAIALVKKYGNVYLDLCDIHRHSGIIEKMVRSVGSEHILFGTDMPWYDPNYCTGSVLCAHITDSDRENIFCKNAERMLAEMRKGGQTL